MFHEKQLENISSCIEFDKDAIIVPNHNDIKTCTTLTPAMINANFAITKALFLESRLHKNRLPCLWVDKNLLDVSIIENNNNSIVYDPFDKTSIYILAPFGQNVQGRKDMPIQLYVHSHVEDIEYSLTESSSLRSYLCN